jgi:hypothetical protein
MTKLDESKRAAVRPSDLFATAVALAAGTQAYGEVVIYINPDPGEPGHFDWDLIDGSSFPGTPAQWLDITLPSTDQSGGYGPSSVGQLHDTYNDGYYLVQQNFTLYGAEVYWLHSGYVYPFRRTKAFSAGELIFDPGGYGAGFDGSGAVHVQDGGSFFPKGVMRYMGVRLSDIDGYHYGWIGVVRQGMDFDAFAWGYETEPGVPIVAGIPAPGTLAALAFGAVVTRRGRKREKS